MMSNENRTNIYHWIRLTNLETGAIIPKGHWGDGLKRAPLRHDHRAREIIYERVRDEEYPDRPSRYESIFLCPNEDSARNFGRRNRASEVCYRVSIMDDDASYFIANWNMMPSKIADYAEVERCAREYWRGGHIPDNVQEIVVESDVRIIERVDLIHTRTRR